MNGLRTSLAAILLSIAPALPAMAGTDSGFYIGAGVGQSSAGDIDVGDFDVDFDGDDTAFKIIGGFNFGIIPLLDLAVEASYVDLGEADDGDLSLDADGFTLFGIAGTTLGPIGIFGKAGLINWDADATLEDVGSGSDDGTDPAYGIGAKFAIGSFQVRGEYEYFDIDAADDVDLLSVSVLYTF